MEILISIITRIPWKKLDFCEILKIVFKIKIHQPIYSSEVPDTASRKTRRRRRTHEIAKCFAFYVNSRRNR